MELFLVWLVSVIVAGMLGNRKGEPGLGILFGVLLGPLGVLIEALRKGNRRECPACREWMHQDASVCPRCREHSSPDLERRGR